MHNAQSGAECAYLPPHGDMAGDIRSRSCHSFIFVSITPQESTPVRRNRRSCNHVLPLCVLRSLVDFFRMSVRYLSQTRTTLLTVSVIYGRNICWHRPTPQMFDKPRALPFAQLQPRPRPWHISQDEYFLVVRTLLSIPLGPISIHVAVGPYPKWTEGTPDFPVQRYCRGCFA